eukprot:1757435-Amphidinium_carterae.1
MAFWEQVRIYIYIKHLQKYVFVVDTGQDIHLHRPGTELRSKRDLEERSQVQDIHLQLLPWVMGGFKGGFAV